MKRDFHYAHADDKSAHVPVNIDVDVRLGVETKAKVTATSSLWPAGPAVTPYWTSAASSVPPSRSERTAAERVQAGVRAADSYWTKTHLDKNPIGQQPNWTETATLASHSRSAAVAGRMMAGPRRVDTAAGPGARRGGEIGGTPHAARARARGTVG